ncbi:MAG: regulatory protein GemA [Desulfobacterota bacterium]|nr:regulatory protein GemA [Thermodesulfobacteriota bacterium]
MSIGRKKKALIHLAKEELHLNEESYRRILKSVAGVDSATQLDREGFKKVMERFQAMGFRGLLPHPSHPIPKGRFIPKESPLGLDSITPSQKDFIDYLLEALNWDREHFKAFCNRIIKQPEPVTKRDGQKIIIGLLAILRKRSLDHKRRTS